MKNLFRNFLLLTVVHYVLLSSSLSFGTDWKTIDKEIEWAEKWYIDGEIYEAQTYCFEFNEGDSIKFLEGTPGLCVSAKFIKRYSNDICEVWCN